MNVINKQNYNTKKKIIGKKTKKQEKNEQKEANGVDENPYMLETKNAKEEVGTSEKGTNGP